MNQTQSYMDMHPGSQMSTGPSYSHTAPASAMPHYSHYPPTAVMPPSSAHYPPAPAYGYGYGNPVTSPQSAGPLPSMMATTGAQPYGHASSGPAPGYATTQPFDSTGQIPPAGMKPRVTATLWEDEGSLCFQVEAKGVCVARREDNHFINGTKLLNVAGMTRGRRDGILKSEKTRHVVKIGPMHLKGVWIPFERALEFANKEKITAELYPLFVHNISSLLYNPDSSSRASNGVQPADRRRIEGADAPRSAQSSQPPPLHHHHSLQNGTSTPVPPTPHSVSGSGRPGIDRAHTFPTPPTSASSVLGMGSSASSYDWNAPGISNGVTSSQPLSIDTGLNNARSMPTTPATTPPGNNTANLNGYPNHQSYDSKHYYAAHTPSSQTGYATQTRGRYDSYGKTDMGPPTAPPSGASDPHEPNKPEPYGASHPAGDSSEHPEGPYMNASGGAYNRSYAYNHGTDHPHLSPEMTNSPSHANTSAARVTPRTMPNPQAWSQEYQTPPRGPSSGLYVSETRTTSTNDAYPTSTYPATGKRGRDDDDDKSDAYKRQKMARPETFGMPLTPTVHMQTIKTGGGLPGQR